MRALARVRPDRGDPRADGGDRRRQPPRAGAGSASGSATTPRSPCPAAPPRPRSTRSSTASTSARSWCPPRSVGRKAMATALSDLAAMGAEPGEAYVWLGAPAGLRRASRPRALRRARRPSPTPHGVAVLGGDLTAAAGALGLRRPPSATPPPAATSSAARGAERRRRALRHRRARRRRRRADAARAPGAGGERVRPRPRRGGDRAPARPAPAARGRPGAGGGRGDGDDRRLRRARRRRRAPRRRLGVAIEIELERVPVGAGVARGRRGRGRDALELVASGGEDYELLCALPRSALEAERGARSGRRDEADRDRPLRDRSGSVRLRLPGGRSLPASGHDHLRAR